MAINSEASPFIQWEQNPDGTRKTIEVLNEQIKIINNQAILNWKPSKYHRVTLSDITVNSSKVTFIEIDLSEEIDSITKFKVNYDNGIIYFHPSLEGFTINISKYYNEGKILYHISRIYYRALNGEIRTLEKYLESDEYIGLMQDIQNQEDKRQSNEVIRISSESTRVNTENTRTSNETTRINNEAQRVANENLRKSTVETIEREYAPRLNSVVSGSPKGVFGSLALLQADTNANTTEGKKYIYITSDNGNWNYWDSSTSTWKVGGLYQSIKGEAYNININDADKNFEATNVEDALKEVAIKNQASNALIGKSTGELLNIYTAPAKARKLNILGNTIATPTDPSKPISPDNIAALESVGDSGSFKLHKSGKNLLPKFQSRTISGVTLTVNADGSVVVNGTTTSDYVGVTQHFFLPDGKYRVSGGETDKAYLQVTYKDDTGVNRYKTNTTFTLSKPTNVILDIQITLSGTILNNYTVYPQLELGTTATTYTPYIGTEYTLPLKDTQGNFIPLRGLTTAKNRVFKDTDGLWKVRGNVEKVVFDGSVDENWVRNEKDGIFEVVLPVCALRPYAHAMCSHFVFDGNFQNMNDARDKSFRIWYNPLIPNSANKWAMFKYTLAGSLESWEQWLQTNHITVYYELATPTITTLHQDAQTVLNGMEQLLDGQTVIYGTDKVAPNFDVEYAKDINKAFEDLTDEITKLKLALINLGGKL